MYINLKIEEHFLRGLQMSFEDIMDQAEEMCEYAPECARRLLADNIHPNMLNEEDRLRFDCLWQKVKKMWHVTYNNDREGPRYNWKVI